MTVEPPDEIVDFRVTPEEPTDVGRAERAHAGIQARERFGAGGGARNSSRIVGSARPSERRL